MQITKTNPITGEDITKEIPVVEKDYQAWIRGEGLIQNLMPYLSPDDREFLITGILPEQWDEMFKEGEQ